MNSVSATPQDIEIMKSYRDAQRRNLKQTPFLRFSAKRWLRAKVAEIDAYINSGKVTERIFDVAGFKRTKSGWDDSKDCYYTEINGLICTIDEHIHQDYLQIRHGTKPQVIIRECPDGEICTAIIMSVDCKEIEDISEFLSDCVPVRSVFPGKYETIVTDINGCTEGLFPHEHPAYVSADVYWFHMHDEYARFASAWSPRQGT